MNDEVKEKITFLPAFPIVSSNSLPVAKEQICGSSIRPPQGIKKFRNFEFNPLEEDSIVGASLISYRRMKKVIDSTIIINNKELKKGDTEWYPDIKVWRNRKDNGIDLKKHVLCLEITIQGNVWNTTPFILHSNQTQLVDKSNLRISYKKGDKGKGKNKRKDKEKDQDYPKTSSKKKNTKDTYQNTLDEILKYVKMKNQFNNYFPNPIKLLLIDNNCNQIYKEILANNLSHWNGLLYTTDKLFFNVDISHVLILGKEIHSHFLKIMIFNNPKVVTEFWIKVYLNTGNLSSGLLNFSDYKWKIFIFCENFMQGVSFPQNFEFVENAEIADLIIK